jgi:hypothetical protein
LFELDQATFVLKYQDEDGDKITVSSDGEVKEAIQLAKEKKVLRLFVELKAQVPPVVPEGIIPFLLSSLLLVSPLFEERTLLSYSFKYI